MPQLHGQKSSQVPTGLSQRIKSAVACNKRLHLSDELPILRVMKQSAPKARLYVADELSASAIITLSKEQSHYVTKVMRQKVGNVVALFNGRDGEWHAEISVASKKATELQVKTQTRPQEDEPDLWLCFAPVKYGKIDFLVQKSTELGVSRLIPVATERTVVKRVNHERLVANVMEAAEQTERLTMPEISSYSTFDKLLEEWPQDRLLIVADETGGGEPPHDLLPVLHDSRLAVLIGPEGGFSPEEIKRLAMLPGARRMSLGPRILRADTAALAALACVQALCGDWREGVPDFNEAGDDDHAG